MFAAMSQLTLLSFLERKRETPSPVPRPVVLDVQAKKDEAYNLYRDKYNHSQDYRNIMKARSFTWGWSRSPPYTFVQPEEVGPLKAIKNLPPVPAKLKNERKLINDEEGKIVHIGVKDGCVAYDLLHAFSTLHHHINTSGINKAVINLYIHMFYFMENMMCDLKYEKYLTSTFGKYASTKVHTNMNILETCQLIINTFDMIKVMRSPEFASVFEEDLEMVFMVFKYAIMTFDKVFVVKH